jgi:hypothetical protein
MNTYMYMYIADKKILSTRHNAERETKPSPVKDNLRMALVVKDLRQTNEGAYMNIYRCLLSCTCIYRCMYMYVYACIY